MESISAFDVIGPVMIGPSSSHTAGAVRIALLARKIVHADIAQADIILYGSFAATYAGHGTDRALVAGLLGFQPDDPRIRDAFAWAEKAGLGYSITTGESSGGMHPNTVDIALLRSGGTVTRVRGVSTGGGAAAIVAIDGAAMELTGEFPTILVKQRDEPGVASHLTRCLAEAGINIASMHIHREGRGKTAFTVVETDQRVDPHLVRLLRDYPSILDVNLID
ncbi:MAG: L-serine ammonia-lyase, iron-sulfur-dependent subunit beta [Planctomycetaceae bacterium]|nr:L-serine ammonia-lyase, iron-sulfur-dependent subunit beta [Planctomycetaceae bacterium]